MRRGMISSEAVREVQPGKMLAHILILQDDSTMQSLSQQTFLDPGYRIMTCGYVRAGLEALCTVEPTAVQPHLMLPDTIDHEICKSMGSEQPDHPVIIVARINKAFEQGSKLTLGADNSVTTPFNPTDLRVTRSFSSQQTPATPTETYTFGQCEIDFAKMTARRADKLVAVTTLEFKLLKYFLTNAERVLSRDELLDEVWGYNCYPTTRTVDNQILKLRQKLEANPTEPRHLRTVYGAGYRFVP